MNYIPDNHRIPHPVDCRYGYQRKEIRQKKVHKARKTNMLHSSRKSCSKHSRYGSKTIHRKEARLDKIGKSLKNIHYVPDKDYIPKTKDRQYGYFETLGADETKQYQAVESAYFEYLEQCVDNSIPRTSTYSDVETEIMKSILEDVDNNIDFLEDDDEVLNCGGPEIVVGPR